MTKPASARSVFIAGALVAALSWSPDQAHAQAVIEFPLPTDQGYPTGITAGPDGALWFVENNGNKIGRITTPGVISEFAIPTQSSNPLSIVMGPDGALWFTEGGGKKIGRIPVTATPASPGIVEFPLPTASSFPTNIAKGPDGDLWFTESVPDRIGKITLTGIVTEFALATNSKPTGITAGPDGAMWFTEEFANKIGRIPITATPASPNITEFPVPTASSEPTDIAPGPDGQIWFVEYIGNKIARLDIASGAITEFPIPTSLSSPIGIAVGPDGALWYTGLTSGKLGRIGTSGSAISEFAVARSGGLQAIAPGPDGAIWFTEGDGNTIGRLTIPAATSTLLAATLPASRSVEVDHPATAFATVINTGASATDCGISAITPVPGTFAFQTTNPATNLPNGTPNTRVSIPAGGSQSFVVAFNPTGPMRPSDAHLGFGCSAVDAAVPVIGLNTLALTFDVNPVPDIIALAATTSGHGIVDIPGTNGTGAFATATVNIGVGSTITVSADSGAASLPETTTICQSNPTNGQCLATPSPTVTTTIEAKATPTFSLFVQGAGNILFDPARNRIFVRFKDGAGITRGSTSVAVRTQ